MPIAVSIDTQRRIIIATLEGFIDFKTIVDVSNRIMSDPAFDPSFHCLVDGTAITDIRVTIDELRELAVLFPFKSITKEALVASRGLAYGIARQFGAFREVVKSGEIQVFSSRDEAMTWLQA